MLNNFSSENRNVYEITWKKNCRADKPQMTIWRTRTACCIPKATKTHSEYVTFIVFFTATIVARTRLSVTFHVHCLSCWTSVCAPEENWQTKRIYNKFTDIRQHNKQFIGVTRLHVSTC